MEGGWVCALSLWDFIESPDSGSCHWVRTFSSGAAPKRLRARPQGPWFFNRWQAIGPQTPFSGPHFFPFITAFSPLTSVLPWQIRTLPNWGLQSFPQGGLQSSSKTAPTSTPQGLLLLLGSRRLPPAASRVTAQGSVPFSKKPDKFRDELTRLGLTFLLTWQDIMVTLAPCCTCNEKEQRLKNARRPSDGLLAASQHHQTYQAGGDEPRTWPMLGLCRQCRQAGRRHYATCLSETMKRCRVKPLNYDKVREVTQEKDESPAVFLSQVTDTWGRTLIQTLSRQKGDH